MAGTIFWKADKPNESFMMHNIDSNIYAPCLNVFYPAAVHNLNETITCGMLTLPQAERTHGVILCKPSWETGAYCGVNDKGLAAANQPVQTLKVKNGKTGLTGGDIVRLVLERCENAEESVKFIIKLLNDYGQISGFSFASKCKDSASFLISDPRHAYLMETSGREWALKKANTLTSISGFFTIGKDFFTSSDGIKSGESFAEKFSNIATVRQSEQKANAESVFEKMPQTIETMLNALRAQATSAKNGGASFNFCSHGGKKDNQTVNSMLAVLRDGISTVWLSGGPVPCLSVYKPVFISNAVPPVFTDERESAEYWRKRSALVRQILAGKYNILKLQDGIRMLESEFIKKEAMLMSVNTSMEGMVEFSTECAAKEYEFWKIAEKNAGDNFVPKGQWAALSKVQSADVFNTNVKVRKKMVKIQSDLSEKLFD